MFPPDHALEVPRAERLPHAPRVQMVHQREQTRLRLLARHGRALDGADLGKGGGLGERWEGVDVLQDVLFRRDADLGSAGEMRLSWLLDWGVNGRAEGGGAWLTAFARTCSFAARFGDGVSSAG